MPFYTCHRVGVPTVVEVIQQPDDDTCHPQGYLYPEAHPAVERETEKIEISIHPEVARCRWAFGSRCRCTRLVQVAQEDIVEQEHRCREQECRNQRDIDDHAMEGEGLRMRPPPKFTGFRAQYVRNRGVGVHEPSGDTETAGEEAPP